MPKLFNRADCLAAKLPHVDVLVPEMGEDVAVRIVQMSVNTRSTYLERIRLHRQEINAYDDDQDKPEDERKGLAHPPELDTAVLSIVMSAVDEDGERLFTDADMPMFETWSSNAVTRLYEAVLSINDYRRWAVEAVELEKKG
ncbi:hypothetical protein U1701_18405 [Sphingomonas sp. PB2P19]|uniref:hypothetical protein n=1 Tax=Sphingomonas rhamnosi TaxID=3096156 RepID=UPI002FC69AAE